MAFLYVEANKYAIVLSSTIRFVMWPDKLLVCFSYGRLYSKNKNKCHPHLRNKLYKNQRSTWNKISRVFDC